MKVLSYVPPDYYLKWIGDTSNLYPPTKITYLNSMGDAHVYDFQIEGVEDQDGFYDILFQSYMLFDKKMTYITSIAKYEV